MYPGASATIDDMNRSAILMPAVAALLLVACGDKDSGNEPATPREMYERAKALIQPNIEHDASDFNAAFEWLRKAAEAGYEQAQTDLGALYMYGGKGIKQDAAQAYEWFNKAAEQGNRAAHMFLGDLLYFGNGVTQDTQAALREWRIAADAGIAEAEYRLGHALVQVDDTASEGLAWLMKAARDGARGGVALAACDLANIYAKGRAGIEKDLQKAAHWYEVAANMGEPRAQYAYSLMLMTGEGIEQDTRKGEAYLRMAAGQSHLPAIRVLITVMESAPDADKHQEEIQAWKTRLNELEAETVDAPSA